MGQPAKPALFKHEGLLSSPRDAQGTVVVVFHEEGRWVGGAFPCFSLQLSSFLEPIYIFKGLYCKEKIQKVWFCKSEVSHVMFPAPEHVWSQTSRFKML